MFSSPLEKAIRWRKFELKNSRGTKVLAHGRKPSASGGFGPAGAFPGQIWVPNWGQVSRFPPQDRAQNLTTGANQGQEWIQHPRNRGTPCGRCQLSWFGWLVGGWGRSASVGHPNRAPTYPNRHPATTKLVMSALPPPPPPFRGC